MSNLWDYRPAVWDSRESTWTMDGDLIGYGVPATDGDVGTIDHATTGAAGAYVVVDLASGVPGGKRGSQPVRSPRSMGWGPASRARAVRRPVTRT